MFMKRNASCREEDLCVYAFMIACVCIVLQTRNTGWEQMMEIKCERAADEWMCSKEIQRGSGLLWTKRLTENIRTPRLACNSA